MTAPEIFARHADELKVVEQNLLEIFSSNVALIPLIGRHILGGGGKRMRPLFLLLSADLCAYHEPRRAHLGAIIEAIHTASLLHDDVIDGADSRRGRQAAHALWGNPVVILVGDYLYSNALKLAVAQKSQKIMETLSEATTRMTEGEILQLHKIGDPDISTEDYFAIISAKTGVLISAACRIGAILSGQNAEREEALAHFGLRTGIAFQLADDILDYVAREKDLGKHLGKDLGEGKITMPLIHLLKAASSSERQELAGIIREMADNQGYDAPSSAGPAASLARIMNLFDKYRSIEKSLATARSFIDDAKKELRVFPDSPEKEALITMAEYAMRREK